MPDGVQDHASTHRCRADRQVSAARPIRCRGADPVPDPRIARRRPPDPRSDGDLVLDAVTPDRITTSDGVALEYRIDAPTDPIGTLVLCHPHPRHGGTMRAPLLGAIATRAVDAGIRVVRFNFRGIGDSGGTWGDGVGEVDDIDAVVGYATGAVPPVIGIAGWSFGAATALVWQATTGSSIPYVGIAPPVASPLTPALPAPGALVPARRTFIIGDRDQFVDADELEAYAEAIDAAIVRYDTADHFFVFRHERLADDLIAAIT